jgi:hypothetical protein
MLQRLPRMFMRGLVIVLIVVCSSRAMCVRR